MKLGLAMVGLLLLVLLGLGYLAMDSMASWLGWWLGRG